MADNRKFVQTQSFTLAASGASLGATSVTFSDFVDLDGTTLTMTEFGSKGYVVLEPGTSRVETISFTGVTDNGDGTVTVTGVSTVIGVDPYTETSGLAKAHAGSVKCIISNPAIMYSDFTNKYNDETVSGTWTFADSAPPQLDGTDAPTTGVQLTNKQYVDDRDETLLDLAGTRAMTGAIDMGSHKITNLADGVASTDAVTVQQMNAVAIAGASDASETVKGIVEEATQAEMDAGTDTGSTSAKLFVPPSKIQSYVSDYVSENAVCGFQEYVVNNVNFGSDDALCVAAEQDGSVVYVGGSEDNVSTGNLRRYERDSATGVLNCTDVVHSGRPTTPIQMALEPLGSYLYQLFEDNGTVQIYRWDKADLTNQTTMTVSSITINASYYSMFTDGTYLWIYNNSGAYEQCTVSGTNITGGGTTITPASITGGPVASHSDGTHVWTVTDTVAANNLYKHLLSDGSLVSSKNYWTDTSYLTDFAAVGYIPQTSNIYDFVYGYTGAGIVSGTPDDVAKIVFKAFTKL